jgi:uncharacterized protein YndB with AHSA1/START domain
MSSAEQSLQSAAAVQDTPVRKSVTVKASQQKTFEVFTAGFDSWWPRSHHIGKSPMKKTFIEGHVGGRCYTEQIDGTECDWGAVTAWEPPKRLVLAWQITVNWQYEPDAAKASEVEIRFTPVDDGSTRVDLEHRNFARMGAGWETMRTMVDGQMGWGELLAIFAAQTEKTQQRKST